MIEKRVKLRFIGRTAEGKLVKGSPGNYKQGEIITGFLIWAQVFPKVWELVEPISEPRALSTLKNKNTYRDITKVETHASEMTPEKDDGDPKTKSILYVIEWSVLGGAGVVLKRLLENIDRSIYKTDVCVMGETGALHEDFASKGKIFNLKDSENKYEELKKIIIEGEYSVVQLYTMIDYLGLAKEIKNTKFICQLNLPLWEFRQTPSKKTWLELVEATEPYFYSLVTDSSQQLAIENMQLIRNGVDTSRFRPGIKDPNLVVWIGRFTREKGFPVMLDIAKAMPDYRFILIIGFKSEYSPGWKSYQTWLDNAVENKPSNVEIKIGLSEDEVAKWLSEASFYVLSSIVESSPMAVTEAMASGCVVLSTNVGDTLNMIHHGKNGFIIPHKSLTEWFNEKEWADLQYHVSPKSEKLDAEIKQYVVGTIPTIDVAEIGRNARESVKHLTVDNQVKRYEFLYGKIGYHDGQTRIAFVWAYPNTESKSWERKVDSNQYTIANLSNENCVILYVPRTKGEKRERAIINGCNIIFYPHNDSKSLVSLMQQFNPNVICLNSLHYDVHKSIVEAFPTAYKTIYEYGENLKYPLLGKIDVLFVQQNFRREEAIKVNNISASKIIVNPHCVNTGIFKPIKTEKIYNAVMVADFRRDIKRQHILIEAWKDVPGKLLLVARLNQPSPYGEYEQQCRQLIKELGLEERVIIQDFVPNNQLPALLNQCKIGVMTSKREGGSRAMLEMMSCGLPVVVLDDSVGCATMIRSGVDGLVCSPKDLGDTTCKLLDNPKKLAEMGEAAATRIHKEYPYDRMLNIYRDVIARVKPEISIITTSLNQGDYLETCIKSVLAQNHQQFKINHIIMDGGSTDGSLNILKKYADRIRYTYGKDRGQTDAINEAFNIINKEYPNTKYVGWINGDDFYEPNFLSKSHAFLNKEPQNVAMTCSDYYTFDMFKNGEKKTTKRREGDWIIEDHLFTFGNIICQPTVLIRKSVLDKLKTEYGFYLNPEYHYTQDYELWCRIAKAGYKIKKIQMELANLRFHAKQMGRTHIVEQTQERNKVLIKFNKNK